MLPAEYLRAGLEERLRMGPALRRSFDDRLADRLPGASTADRAAVASEITLVIKVAETLGRAYADGVRSQPDVEAELKHQFPWLAAQAVDSGQQLAARLGAYGYYLAIK